VKHYDHILEPLTTADLFVAVTGFARSDPASPIEKELSKYNPEVSTWCRGTFTRDPDHESTADHAVESVKMGLLYKVCQDVNLGIRSSTFSYKGY
jgi:hypothetical protein